MPHYTPLIATIVFALVLAYAAGALALRLKLAPIVGYLLAGVAGRPFTPGFVADQPLAAELSEIGVILLMFGVGLHFSLGDLLAVRAIAIPGAAVQIAFATMLGLALAWAARLVRSAQGSCSGSRCRSRARSCCCARSKSETACSKRSRGRIAVGWLIVEDLAMVLVLGAAAAARGDARWPRRIAAHAGANIYATLGITFAKVAAFVAFMLIVGRRAIPWLLERTAGTRFARALHARGARDRARRRVRVGAAFRCVVRARRVLRGHGAQGIRS